MAIVAARLLSLAKPMEATMMPNMQPSQGASRLSEKKSQNDSKCNCRCPSVGTEESEGLRTFPALCSRKPELQQEAGGEDHSGLDRTAVRSGDSGEPPACLQAPRHGSRKFLRNQAEIIDLHAVLIETDYSYDRKAKDQGLYKLFS
jgi:hypothetical protein